MTKSSTFRPALAAAALSLAVAWTATAVAAESLDSPSVQTAKPLPGASTQSGSIDARVGFPAHVYTAKNEGLVKIVMTTTNVKPNDNGGIAWRPYLRVISQSNPGRNGEAWSSNGYQVGPNASAEVVFRAHPGEKFTVVTTLAQHIIGPTRVNANYTVTVKE